MSEFKDGFLSKAVESWVNGIRNQYPDEWALFSDMNRLAVAASHAVAPTRDSLREVLATVLFARTLMHCQASSLLLERGMRPSSEAMARVALEALFTLGAVAVSEENAKRFVDNDEIDRPHMLKAAKESIEMRNGDLPLSLDSDIAQAELEARELEARNRGKPNPFSSAKSMAEEAGLDQLYIAYKGLSQAVHTEPRDLESHFELDAEGNLIGLKNEPDVSEAGSRLIALVEIQETATEVLLRMFPGVIEVEHLQQIQGRKSAIYGGH